VTLVVALVVAVGFPAAAGRGTLLSSWSPFAGSISLNELDPQTGQQGKQLYASPEFQQFFAMTPAIDYANKRAFIATFGQPGDRFPTVLLGFDFSKSPNATLVTRVALPNAYVMSLQYDPVNDRVFVISTPLKNEEKDPPTITIPVGYVDLRSNTFKNFTNLPAGVIPSEGGIGGGASIVMSNKRLIAVACMTQQPSPSRKYSLVLINMDSGQITNVPFLANYIPVAMALNTKTNQIMALFSNTTISPLTFGTIDIAGKITSIRKWTSLSFVFVVGSMSTMDSEDNKMYTVLGNGAGPPVALVTIDTTTGERLNAAYFSSKQPKSIFYLPQ